MKEAGTVLSGITLKEEVFQNYAVYLKEQSYKSPDKEYEILYFIAIVPSVTSRSVRS